MFNVTLCVSEKNMPLLDRLHALAAHHAEWKDLIARALVCCEIILGVHEELSKKLSLLEKKVITIQ